MTCSDLSISSGSNRGSPPILNWLNNVDNEEICFLHIEEGSREQYRAPRKDWKSFLFSPCTNAGFGRRRYLQQIFVASRICEQSTMSSEIILTSKLDVAGLFCYSTLMTQWMELSRISRQVCQPKPCCKEAVRTKRCPMTKRTASIPAGSLHFNGWTCMGTVTGTSWYSSKIFISTVVQQHPLFSMIYCTHNTTKGKG